MRKWANRSRSWREFRDVFLLLGAPGALMSAIRQLTVRTSSPLPAPRFDLAFDSTTAALWGIENATASANVMNFTLDGSFVSGFLTASNFNNMGIAVNQLAGESKRIYYWQNLPNLIREVDTNGAPVGSTSLRDHSGEGVAGPPGGFRDCSSWWATSMTSASRRCSGVKSIDAPSPDSIATSETRYSQRPWTMRRRTESLRISAARRITFARG